MFTDAAVKALKCRDAAWTREQLDGQNSSERPLTYYEVVSRDYNEESLVFYTEALADLHHCFRDSIKLVLGEMPGGKITIEDCKKKIAQAKTILQVVSMNATSWQLSDNSFC